LDDAAVLSTVAGERCPARDDVEEDDGDAVAAGGTGLTRRGLVEPDCAKVATVAATNIKRAPPVLIKREIALIVMNCRSLKFLRELIPTVCHGR
jgi:hypothetical protein